MPVASATLSLVALSLLKRQVWANRVFGNPTIAAALLAEYYSEGRFLPAKELAKLAHVSEDTARRTLRKLASIGRVEERVIDRAHVYRIAPELAEKAITMVIKTEA